MKVSKNKKKPLKKHGKKIGGIKKAKDNPKRSLQNKDILNKERYWKKDVPEESNKVIKPKNNLNSYENKRIDFIGLGKDSRAPTFLTKKQKKKLNNLNSEKFIERQNLNKKIDFDAITTNKTLGTNVDRKKSWQGSTYDTNRKSFTDKSNFTQKNPRIFSDKKSVKTDSETTNKELVDSLKVEIPFRPKAEFIRQPEGDVKYYESKWFSEFRNDPFEETKLPEEEIAALRGEAEKILIDEIKNFHSKSKDRQNNQEAKWMKTVVTKGTSGDKVAAQVIMIQDDPLFHLSTLNSLVNSVKVSKKKECLLIIENLTSLFLTCLLHPSRHLLTFDAQPLAVLSELTSGNALARRRRLALWLFEHELKSSYLRFVMALTTILNDTVQANREKAISAVTKLLVGNPENEELLLANLVNKIGDPVQKVSAKVVYSLAKLITTHPGCKQVVLNQVEKLLFRPNIGRRAQYYGTCFLAQFRILRNEATVADSLMNIYFSFFKSCVKTGDIDSRLMKALLTGVTRAFPYATKEKAGGDHVISGQHIETIFKIVHLASFSVSVHALSLLFRVARSDRYYSALYKQLLHPKFPLSSMQNLFLNITYQSVDKDENEARVRTFIKRLLEVCMTCPVPLACGILFVTSQLLQRRPHLLHSKVTTPGFTLQGFEDEEERFVDVKEEDDKDNIPPVVSSAVEPAPITIDDDAHDVKPVIGGSWMHRAHLTPKIRSAHFEPLHRNPAYANGDKAVFTELETLNDHFHPTVALFAGNILSKSWVTYSGDPLQDFTMSRFLDRFSYRNPKKHHAHILATGVGEKRRFYNPSGLKGLGVNTEEYLNHNEQSIPVDELFLYRYLRQKRDKKQTEMKDVEEKKKDKDEDSSDDDDNSSVASEEFEEMLDNMMGGKETEDLDFADDVTANKSHKKDKKKKEDDEDSDGSEDGEEDFDGEGSDRDEEMNGDDSDLDGSEMDEASGDEVMDFGEDGDVDDDDYDDDGGDFTDDSDDEPKIKSKKKLGGTEIRGRGISSMFAPAEHFSEMLEDNADAKSGGTLAQLSNRDNSGEKQMAWETKRNWKMNSYPSRGGGRGNDFQRGSGGPRGGRRGGSLRGGRGDDFRGGRGVFRRGRGSFRGSRGNRGGGKPDYKRGGGKRNLSKGAKRGSEKRR